MYTLLYIDYIYTLRLSKNNKRKINIFCLQFLVSLWKMNGRQKEWKKRVSKPPHSSRKCDRGYWLKRHTQMYLGVAGGKLCSPERQIGWGAEGEGDRVLKHDSQVFISLKWKNRDSVLRYRETWTRTRVQGGNCSIQFQKC